MDDSVEFVQGYFDDTLHELPVERIAVLRLDGDYYSSTMDILTALYHKVSDGGWLIIDDYGISSLGCKRAVDEFRQQRGITEPLHLVDEQCVFWQKQKPF